MKRSHWATILAIVSVGVLALGSLSVSCTASGQETPKNGGTLVLWMSQAPNTFLGYYSLGDQARYPCDLIFDRLYVLEPDGTFHPRLATACDTSQDGLTYTFHLDPNAMWQDGTPVTAKDVEFTIDLLANGSYTGSNASDVMPIVGAQAYHNGKATRITGISILDSHTVSLTLDAPSASFFEMFATQLWILPEHLLSGIDVAKLGESAFAMHPVGDGPFEFVDYKQGDSITLQRFDDYHLGRPHLDKVVIRIMNPEAAVAAMETGEVDACLNWMVAPLPADSIKSLQENPDIAVSVFPSDGFDFLAQNLQQEPMQQEQFRQAVSYAINRKALVTAVEQGLAIPGYTMLMPNSPYNNQEVNRYSYDPAKAKALLKKINWTGKKTLVFGCPNDPRRQLIATMVQQNLAAVGIKTKIEVYDFATMMAKASKGDFDIWLLGWSSGGIQYPGYTLFEMLDSTQWPPGWNFSWYKNPEVDRLLALGARTTDRTEAIKIFQQIQTITSTELPYIILLNRDGYSARRTSVHNYQDFVGGTTYNPEDWWVG